MICSMFGLREEGWRFEHTHLKMSSIQHQIHRKNGVFTRTFPLSPSPLSPFSVTTMHKQSSPSSSGSRISPAVLFIIVILAVLFFISGLLHLLVRFLTKHHSSASGNSESNDRYPETSSSDALQRQLQQLFHLHDSGLDQAFIDALPVFMYKEIVGLKEPFDCAVCLCEFSDKDKLRLLPTCSHAFHIDCIDTWLLSNSTCPLCRDTLFNPDFSIENPIFNFDDSREDDENGLPSGQTQKSIEIEQVPAEKKGVFPVRLGKFRKLNVGEGGEAGGETSSRNLDARRCYSMGSYEYVVVDSSLKVALSHERDLKLEREHGNPSVDEDMEGKKISIGTKTDSYSVSKIWLWSKKGKFASSAGIQMHNPSSINADLPWLDKHKNSIEAMDVIFSKLSDLRKGRSDWTIKVKVARKYHIKETRDRNLPESYELVLVDLEGERIQATIPKVFITKLASKVDEYGSYAISNFSVVDNRAKFKVTAHQYKLYFMDSTDIINIGHANLLFKNLFKLKPFPEVLAIKDAESCELIDVLGRVVSKGRLKYQSNSKLVEIEIEDNSKNTLLCTFWGDFADDILTHVETAGDSPLIVLLQLMKPKSYDGKISLVNAFFGTKILIHALIPEFDELKSSFIGDSSSSQKINELSSTTNNCTLGDLKVGNVDIKTVADLKSCTEDGYYWIVGQISEVIMDGNWNFISCQRCKSKLSWESSGFKCPECNRVDHNPTPRYKVKVSIISGDENATFMLWDGACDPLIKKTAMQLKEQYMKVSNDGETKKAQLFIPYEIIGLVGRNAIFKVKVKPENLSGKKKVYSVGMACDDKEIVDKYMEKSISITKRKDVLMALNKAGVKVIEIEDSVSDIEEKTPNNVGIKRRLGFLDDTATSNLFEDDGSATKSEAIILKAVKTEQI